MGGDGVETPHTQFLGNRKLKFMRDHGSDIIWGVEGCHNENFENLGKPSREFNLHEVHAL